MSRVTRSTRTHRATRLAAVATALAGAALGVLACTAPAQAAEAPQHTQAQTDSAPLGSGIPARPELHLPAGLSIMLPMDFTWPAAPVQ